MVSDIQQLHFTVRFRSIRTRGGRVTRLSEILVSYTCQIREDPATLTPILDLKLPYLGEFLASSFGREPSDMGHVWHLGQIQQPCDVGRTNWPKSYSTRPWITMPSKKTTSAIYKLYKHRVECWRAPTLDFEDVKILENPVKIPRKYVEILDFYNPPAKYS